MHASSRLPLLWDIVAVSCCPRCPHLLRFPITVESACADTARKYWKVGLLLVVHFRYENSISGMETTHFAVLI